MASQASSSSMARALTKRRLKPPSSRSSSLPMKPAISSSRVLGTSMGPMPVRSQTSFTPYSRQIRASTASVGLFRPDSYWAIVFCFTPIFSAKAACVSPRDLRSSLIRSRTPITSVLK
nr:MAG TPA: hypothetical protein [Caudoviricetes sp.]